MPPKKKPAKAKEPEMATEEEPEEEEEEEQVQPEMAKLKNEPLTQKTQQQAGMGGCSKAKVERAV